MTALPSVWDLSAQQIDNLAKLFVPAAVSGALKDARQFVDTTPGIRVFPVFAAPAHVGL
jgi:hypothetical protein